MTFQSAQGGSLTVKGQQITSQQYSLAQTLLSIGTSLHAPVIAKQACIFAAIFESDLGLDNGWDASNPTYGGVLAGNIQYFGNLGASSSSAVTNAEAHSFYKGGNGYQAGGAITAAATYSDLGALAAAVEAPFDASDPPPYGQYLRQGGIALIRQVNAEAKAIVASLGGGTGTTGGGISGAGGTGTASNSSQPASPWMVGNTSNPDEDYWTAINQYCQNAQLYCFSDGETLFVADGIELMAQTPVAVIFRNSLPTLSSTAAWDNSAFSFVVTHAAKGNIIRRAALAKVVSPTQATCRVICNIDEFRGGDVVLLKGFGPADGPWLVGQAQRSIFLPYTDLTLVQGLQPIDAATGQPGSPVLSGRQASRPGAGTVIAAMISEAATISHDDYPYVWGGGHSQAGVPSIGVPGGNGYDGHTKGFDCSGSVGAVLAAGGLLQWHSAVPGDYGIIQQLQAANILKPGQGSGTPECTLFNNPGVHIFMRMNGRYWGTSDGEGGNHSQPNGGAGWLNDAHSDVATFNAYHVPAGILGRQANAVLGGTTG